MASEDLSIDEEYKLWRQNCHYMYDFIVETALTWPLLTVEWLPAEEEVLGLLLGTNTSGGDTNYVKVARIALPHGTAAPDAPRPKLKVSRKLVFGDDEVNRARAMPQDLLVVAAIGGAGVVRLFKTNALGLVELHHHGENGFGLDWNRERRGWLVLGADDGLVAVWDSAVPETPVRVMRHRDVVNDVKWHGEHVVGSVSDDATVRLWDSRSGATSGEVQVASNTAVNALAFHPKLEYILATGNGDCTVDIYDLRLLSRKLHTMMGHSDLVSSLQWLPHHDGVLALASQDRRVMVWDLARVGLEQQQDDMEDGAPELVMMHAGHTSAVQDVAWHPTEPWTVASCSDDNVVHVWRVAEKLVSATQGWTDEVDPAVLE